MKCTKTAIQQAQANKRPSLDTRQLLANSTITQVGIYGKLMVYTGLITEASRFKMNEYGKLFKLEPSTF